MRLRIVGLLVLSIALGCARSSPSMHVWGSVTYEGAPVNEGQIIFFPVENTTGPSTGGIIRDGRYDIDKRSGPYARGVYRVQITALGVQREYNPNASGSGPAIAVREQFLPPQFNQNSKLQVTISPDARKNQHDFHLRSADQ